MRRFQFIEHTADTGLVAFGDSLAEAFANAAYGLFSIITDLRRVRSVVSRTVVVTADDAEGLLFEWLNHLLYLFDVEHLLLKSFDIRQFTGTSLEAVCRGEPYQPGRHRLKMGVKSATYHQMEVDARNNRVRVIFDV
ncbi:MAG: archease [Chloroflexota bacterium]